MKRRLLAFITALVVMLNFNMSIARSFSGNSENSKLVVDLANDVGISLILIKNCSGNQNVQMLMKNYGTNTITSCTINWSIDGVKQASYYWTGSLLSSLTVNVVLGTATFAVGKQYKIKAWTSLINDSDKKNDTLSVTTNSSRMIGTYTVGGNNPNFRSLQMAIDTISTYGICGPVVLNIRNGTYPEYINIPAVIGSSATNTLTIQSESGDSTTVILGGSPTETNSSTGIAINGVKYLTIRKLTIRSNLANSYSVVYATGVTYFTLSSNILEGGRDNSTSEYQAVIRIKDPGNASVTIENNKIFYGSEGIHLENVYGVSIKNNRLEGQYSSGMYLSQCSSNPLIEKNTILSTSSNSQYIGIKTTFGSNERISKNKIMCANGTGIYLSSTGLSNNKGLISNNYVEVNGVASEKGIHLINSSYQNVYHNSINVKSAGIQSAAIYLESGSEINLMNNIFSAEQGYALYNKSTSPLDTSNFNDFYTRGTTLAMWINVPKADLIEYRAASGNDTNSIFAAPNFAQTKKYVASSVLLNNAGVKINQVVDDIEGKLRNVTTPDIGANEFTTYVNDAGVAAINPSGDICYGANTIKAILTNYGSNPITTATINWSINGVLQTPYSWTGSLASGDASALINIGTYNATALNKNIQAWSSIPNGNVDGNSLNDSVKNDKNKGKLYGTYTIGGVLPDFLQFRDAVDALVLRGVCGPVVFNVRSALYFESLITIPFIQGSSAMNTITFQSETGKNTDVILMNKKADVVCITLNKAEYIIFKNMSFGKLSSSAPSSGTVFQLDQTRNIEISGNKFETTTDDHIKGNAKNYGLTISNNTFERGRSAVSLNGSATNPDSLTLISGNTFTNQLNSSIYVLNGYAPIISANTITVEKDIYHYFAIQLYTCVGGWKIEKNKISGGIISTQTCTSTQKTRGVIANNFISISDTAINGMVGISLMNGGYVDIINNNILISTSGLNPSQVNNGAVDIQATLHCRVLNNNISNKGGQYVYYIGSSSVTMVQMIDTIDYNNIQNDSPYFCNQYPTLKTFSAWKASSGCDQHSISIDPNYLSTKDLHVTNIALEGKGKSFANITDDIDGEVRALTPDIGADEFTLAPNDAGVVAFVQPELHPCPGAKEVSVQIRNFGINNLTSISINLEINGVAQAAVPWTGNLVMGQSELVKLSIFNFSSGVYSLKAWTTIPNGVTDIVGKNDTAFIQSVKTSLNGTYIIGDTASDFETINAAVTYLKENGVCGPVVFNIRKGVYNERITLPKIEGTSSVNTITFQSMSGINTDVLIQGNTSDAGYVLKFDGVSYINIKNITFKTLVTSDYYSKLIGFLSKTNNTRIEGCLLYGGKNGSPDLTSVIYGNNANDKNSLVNNTILNGGYGIYWLGDISTNGVGLTIEGNRIKDGANGIYISNSRNLRCSSNEVTSASTAAFEGMRFYNCSDFEISKNKINIAQGSGIELWNCAGSDTVKQLLVNNFVSVADGTFGVKVYKCGSVEAYYNSIHIITKGDAIVIEGLCDNCKPTKLYNNIFSNAGSGYAINVADFYSLVNSDYNCLYTNTTAFAYYNRGAISNLVAWKATTKLDDNSISANPGFIAATNLHVNNNSLVGGAGKPFTLVPTDIDGDVRDAIHSDIGADEFIGKGGDAGITKILPDTIICYGTRNVFASIKNYDADTLTSVIISWGVNGITQNNYSWTGKLAPGATVNSINVGPYAFNSESPYVISAWVVSPNGSKDNNPLNDTSRIVRKVNGIVTIDIGSDTSYVCVGQSIVLSAGAGYVSYSWKNEQGAIVSTTSTYTAITRGKYIVTVTNASGCIGKDSAFVIMKDDSFTRTNFGYTYAYVSSWKGVAWTDHNGDDTEDIGLFSGGDNQFNIIATNKGKGKFVTQKIAVGGFATGGSFGDCDNDGDADVAYSTHNYHSVFENKSGIFENKIFPSQSALSTTWVDYDNNGSLDIALTHSNTSSLMINRSGNAVINFWPDTTLPYGAVSQAWSDYDKDGDQDWLVLGTYNTRLFANDGKGNFKETTTTAFGGALAAGYGASWGDYDNDGNMDLFITTSAENILYKNNGNGTFTKITAAGTILTDKKYSKGSAWGDYDNDGYLDIFVNNYYVSPESTAARSNSLFHNNGDGTFTENTGSEWLTPTYESWGNNNCAWGDLDNDGDIDLIQGSDYQVNQYINNGSCRNWLEMKLTGTISNRSAIGARVYVYAVINGKAQILSREVSGQTGYSGQNSLRLHFGLGSTTTIDSIKIDWPSGIKKVLTNVLANQYLKITEECTNDLCNTVWPGDANSDLVANNKDLLYVGLAYNESGAARDSISNSWKAQKAMSWGKLQTNGLDMKHADSNGDGTVNNNDTLAINLNYGLKHKPSAPDESNMVDPDLYFIPSKTSASPGDWIDVAIAVGTSVKPVTDLYGLAFTVGFDVSLIEPGSISINYAVSWLGTPLTDAIRISKIFENYATADGAISRIDHINKSGNGKIATLRFRIKPSLTGSQKLQLNFKDYEGVNAAGNNKSFNMLPNFILISPIILGLNTTTAFSDFEIHPNPFKNQTEIAYTLSADKNVSLELYNMLGQKIETFVVGKQAAGKYSYIFSKEGKLTGNIFIVKLVVDNHVSVLRIISVR